MYLTYINNVCAASEKLSHLDVSLLFFRFPSEEEELRRAAPSPCKLSLRNAWQCDLEFWWSLNSLVLCSVYVYAVYAQATILPYLFVLFSTLKPAWQQTTIPLGYSPIFHLTSLFKSLVARFYLRLCLSSLETTNLELVIFGWLA